MEELFHQDHELDRDGCVIVDIESLVQSTDRSSGSPKMTKILSRKSSNRTERRNAEDVEVEDGSKKDAGKVTSSQVDLVNQVIVSNKTLAGLTTIALTEAGDGRCRRFNRITGIHPRRILLLFATMSSLGTMILIYFTLAMNREDAT